MTTGIDFWDDPPADALDADGNPVLWATGPTFMSNPWDVVFINGDPIPGVCVVDGAPKIQIDKKKPGGADGLTLTSTGLLPGPVDIDVTLFTKDQWEFFQALVPKIWVTPNRGDPVKAVQISHPAFDLWKVNMVIVESVSVPKRGSIAQTMVVKIRCQQFIPPTKKNRTKTPKAPSFPENDKRIGSLKAEEAPSSSETGPAGKKNGKG